jgi:hypothetical protein
VGEQPAGEQPADEQPADGDRVVSALPFSGLDLGLLAAAAALLGLSGLALRRLTRAPSEGP